MKRSGVGYVGTADGMVRGTGWGTGWGMGINAHCGDGLLYGVGAATGKGYGKGAWDEMVAEGICTHEFDKALNGGVVQIALDSIWRLSLNPW